MKSVLKFFLASLLLSAPMTAFAEEVKVGVKGMVCAFCAQGIKKKFSAMPEVASVDVSLTKKQVTIQTKDGATLPREKIAEALKDAGYEIAD